MTGEELRRLRIGKFSHNADGRLRWFKRTGGRLLSGVTENPVVLSGYWAGNSGVFVVVSDLTGRTLWPLYRHWFKENGDVVRLEMIIEGRSEGEAKLIPIEGADGKEVSNPTLPDFKHFNWLIFT